MQALLYCDLTTKTASLAPGGGQFAFPKLTQSDNLTLALRFTKKAGTISSPVAPEVTGMRAAIGRRDARPTGGTYRLQVGEPTDPQVEGTNLTVELAWDAAAADIEAALNDLTAVTDTAVVEAVPGGFVIVFDGAITFTPLTPRNNKLKPSSFARVMESLVDDERRHELRLIQSPAAFVDAFALRLPPAPEMSQLQAGGTDGSIIWNEVQRLFVPPTFEGSFILKRGFARTSALSKADNADSISEALQTIADEDGSFVVTNDVDNAVLIEFKGSMGGGDEALLEIVVISAPPGDPTIVLDLGTAEMAAILRDAMNGSTRAELKLPFEVEIDYTIDGESYTSTVISTEVVIVAEVLLTEFATPANIDFIRPPSPVNYKPRGTGQIAVGVMHWSGPIGDGVATVFAIDHNLASEIVLPVVRENISGGAILRLGVDYTLALTTDDTLTLTFPDPPDADEFLVYVAAFGAASAWESHTHSTAEVTGLDELLAAMDDRLMIVEERVGIDPGAEAEGTAPPGISYTLPAIAVLFGVRSLGTIEVTNLAEFDRSVLPRKGGGLLAAVHANTFTVLPDPLPTPASEFVGTLYKNTSGDTVALPGGLQHRTQNLLNGEFCACDGRLWYKVTPHVSSFVSVAVDAGTDVLSATAHGWANGTRIRFEDVLSGSLPAPLVGSTDYFVRDKTDDTFKLAATLGGAAIDLTTAGSAVLAYARNSWFPADFERELFMLAVTSEELRLGQQLEILFGFETMLMKSESRAQWMVIVEHGEITSDPASGAANLYGIQWHPQPILQHRFFLSDVPAMRNFGVRIKRKLVSSVDTITSAKLLYGTESGGDAAPSTANFAIRARLAAFDTEDNVASPTGFVALSGLFNGTEPAKAIIKKL